MKKAKKLGCIMLICTLFFTMMMPYPVLAADYSRTASIVDMEGEVQILKAGGEKAFSAFKGMNLTQGDRIITGNGAWVKLDIDQNKEIKLAENTDMTMSELLGSVSAKNDQTFLSLLVGKVWIFIKEKLNVNAKFEIKTPTTVMGVRGTQFFVQEQDGQTYVTVVEGTVAASTYAVVENPDGTIQLQPVEVTLNQNQQVAFDAGVRSGEAPQVQEAQLETMDRFMLEAIRDSVPGLAPETVERMDKLIEQRRAEEVQQQQKPQQNEIIQSSVIRSSDITTTTTSSEGDDDSSPVVVPAPKISTVTAVNGTINVVFDRNLSGAPQKDDFEVKQNVYEADAVLMDITQVQWDNGSNVTLKVGPLQPGTYEQEFYYSVGYKEDAAKETNNITVPGIESGDVQVAGNLSGVAVVPETFTPTTYMPFNLEITDDQGLLTGERHVIITSNNILEGVLGTVLDEEIYLSEYEGKIYGLPQIMLTQAGHQSLNIQIEGVEGQAVINLEVVEPYVPNSTNIGAGYSHGLSIENGDNSVSLWGQTYLTVWEDVYSDAYSDVYGGGMPVKIDNLSNVKKIAGGQDYTVALKNDGTVWTWGINYNGQLGNGNTEFSIHPIQVSALNGIKITDIAAGAFHVVALDEYGRVWAWGSNGGGQLGNYSSDDSYVPIRVVNGNSESESGYLENVKAIAAGALHTVALKNDGTVWTWGSNSFGQLGDGDTSNYMINYPIKVVQDADTLPYAIKIAAGQDHTLALNQDGTLWAWGNNSNGQLGNGKVESNSVIPVQVVMPKEDGSEYYGIMQLAAGGRHSLALKDDGTVWGWGDNSVGQIGRTDQDYYTDTNILTPVQVIEEHSVAGAVYLQDAKVISAGYDYSLALKNDGTVWAWGDNNAGQLGNGQTYLCSYTPVQVGMLEESYPPKEENIHVNNDQEGMDSITVGGIPPESIVKIYDAEVGGNLLGAAKGSWDDVTVNLTEGDLDQVSGSIWITVIEDVGFKESIRVRKTF